MINRILIYVFLIAGVIEAQNFHFQEEMDGAFLARGALTITATGNTLKISHPKTGDVSLRQDGIKKFITSPDGLGVLVINYNFTPGKNDIPVNYYYATSQNGLVFQSSLTSPFDLPHPKFSLDNSGNIYLFDPMKMTLTVTGVKGERKVQIQENPPFEMEKTFYLKCGTDFVLGASNIHGRLDEGENIVVFRYSPQTGELQKELIAGSTISAMAWEDSRLQLVVTREGNQTIEKKSFLFSENIAVYTETAKAAGHNFVVSGSEFTLTNGSLTMHTADGTAKSIEPVTGKISGKHVRLNENNVLIELLTGSTKEFALLQPELDFTLKNTGITLSGNARYDMFMNDNKLFVIEEYKKTLIYSLQ